ncbi:MAG: hypothetical protein WDO17_21980 [Alphaproteobacteria bacterium]
MPASKPPPADGTAPSPEASRHDELALRVIANEPIITKYKELVDKGRRLAFKGNSMIAALIMDTKPAVLLRVGAGYLETES